MYFQHRKRTCKNVTFWTAPTSDQHPLQRWPKDPGPNTATSKTKDQHPQSTGSSLTSPPPNGTGRGDPAGGGVTTMTSAPRLLSAQGKLPRLLSHVFFSSRELLFPGPREISSAADCWEPEKWFINFPLALGLGTWLHSIAATWLLGLLLPGVSWCLEPLHCFFTQVYFTAIYRIVSAFLGAIFLLFFFF